MAAVVGYEVLLQRSLNALQSTDAFQQSVSVGLSDVLLMLQTMASEQARFRKEAAAKLAERDRVIIQLQNQGVRQQLEHAQIVEALQQTAAVQAAAKDTEIARLQAALDAQTRHQQELEEFEHQQRQTYGEVIDELAEQVDTLTGHVMLLAGERESLLGHIDELSQTSTRLAESEAQLAAMQPKLAAIQELERERDVLSQYLEQYQTQSGQKIAVLQENLAKAEFEVEQLDQLLDHVRDVLATSPGPQAIAQLVWELTDDPAADGDTKSSNGSAEIC